MQQPGNSPAPKRRSNTVAVVLAIVAGIVVVWILLSLVIGLPAYRAYQQRQGQEQAAPAASTAPEHGVATPGSASPVRYRGLASEPSAGQAAPATAPSPASGQTDDHVRQNAINKVNGAVLSAAQLKLDIAQHHRERGVCPVNGVGRIAGASDYSGPYHRSMFVGRTASGDCAIEITLQDSAGHVPDGAKVWWEYAVANGTWRCHSELPNDHLPVQCRS